MLPAPFRELFDPERLAREHASIVALDANATILWVNEAWTAFARANGGEAVLERFATGASYLSGITGPERSFFEDVFARALRDQELFEHDYECSSPTVRRTFRMRVLPIRARWLLIEHSRALEVTDDATARRIDAAHRRRDGFVVQCSNCRRFRRRLREEWSWVPEWTTAPPDPVTHGICASCLGYFWGRTP